MARVLIAGCGYVGSALGRLLIRRGDEVFGLRRRPDALPPGIRPVRADLADAATLDALPPDLDRVVYAASPGDRSEDQYRLAYVEGLSNLLRALERRGDRLRRMLFTSSTAVYGQRHGEWVDEESPADPSSATARRLREAEELCLDGPFPATVVRFAGIYGPGRTRLVDRVRRGEARIPPGEPVYTNRIHRDDCAGVLAHLMDVTSPAALYLGVDHEPADVASVLGWLAKRLQVTPPAEDPGAFDPARGRNKRCRNTRLVDSGYKFRYPTFREGYSAILDDLTE